MAKTAIVTGANAGMGLATSIGLLKEGWHIIMVCRSEERGRAAVEQALRASGGQGTAELMLCDLGSLASIRRFAAEFLATGKPLDVLINNAGVISLKRQETADGFELMLGVNHLGHFLLTLLLLGRLKEAEQGRIVIVSSGAYKVGRLDFADLNLTRGFNVMRGYGQSKLANILFTTELARRLEGTNVTVNCLHPGAVATSLGVNRSTGFGKGMYALMRPFFLTAEEGSQTALYLARHPEVAKVSGEYYYKQRPQRLSSKAADRKAAEQLWAWSVQQTGAPPL
nr:SDR family oxidoreductase [Paenibacillus sp. SYP-B4298]